jgi:2-polyprenyl-3-methyl-5-hydroxy-6-metoxy-1,4-benzoquinol methylase
MSNIREFEWNENLIRSFWNEISGTAMDSVSFGKAAGPKLIEICRRYIPENSCILDYGSGSGDFLEILLKEGFVCSSFDISQERNHRLEKLSINYANYLGPIIDFETKKFDVVFCNEVIEHIIPQKLPYFLAKITSLVNPNGILIITTPNNENLDDSMCLCANCIQTFHRWQHMNSFTIEKIKDKLMKYGFMTIDYFLTDFSTNAEALTAWRELTNIKNANINLDNNKYKSGMLEILGKNLKRIILSLNIRIRIARKAWEIVLNPESIKPKPGEVFGNGSALIYVGKRVLSN